MAAGERVKRARWQSRERNTAALVRACYDHLVGRRAGARRSRRRSASSPSAAELHALCRLTWITKSSDGVADNTRAVVAPALSVVLDAEVDARDLDELGVVLDRQGAPSAVATAARKPVGFVNF